MKTVILIAIIVTCTQASAFRSPLTRPLPVIHPQQLSTSCSFSTFRGHRQGKSITLMWSMTNNQGISRFEVECTYEDPNDEYSVWVNKGTVPANSLKFKKFHDANVLPGTMNYRVIAKMTDGTSVVSEIRTLRIIGH